MSKLTLDEAIKHCLEAARQNEDSAILYKNCKEIKRNTYEVLTAEAAEQKCLSCAAEHRQLAEWLKELKELKNSVGAVELELLKEAQAELEKRGNMLHDAIAELEEVKQLLKAAVDDLKFESQCRNCKHEQTGLDNICNGCRGNKYEWRYGDEALKLIGDESNGI